MEVFACGTKVIIGKDIEAVVTGIHIRGQEIQYEVSWWASRTHNSEFLMDYEVVSAGVEDEQTVCIGFNGNGEV